MQIGTDNLIAHSTLKPIIIEKNFGFDNIIYLDIWSGFNFISRPNLGYFHDVSNHQRGKFGLTSEGRMNISFHLDKQIFPPRLITLSTRYSIISPKKNFQLV